MSEETAVATPLTRPSWILHIFAALAEKERRDIGAGAKAALAAARARVAEDVRGLPVEQALVDGEAVASVLRG